MPIESYGVLKGRATDCRQERDYSAPHYQIRLRAGGTDFRVAVNVRSVDHARPELLHRVEDDFRHPVTGLLAGLPEGFHPLERGPGGMALDYVRGGLLRRDGLRTIPHTLPGADNDLNEKLDHHLRRALHDPRVVLHAFGSRWGPEGKRDAVFRFAPGNGMHDVHMNQGSPRRGGHSRDNGVFQDGALLLHDTVADRWTAVFLAFQSQSWSTDDRTGHPVEAAPGRRGGRARAVRIVAARVNPRGVDAGAETVTLLNTTRRPVELAGWTLANRQEHRHRLAGVLLPGTPLTVPLPPQLPLGNGGDVITLRDAEGHEVDGVSYTPHDAREEGRTLRF